MSDKQTLEDVEDIEVELLIEGIHHRYGYDFTHYSRAHMKRRIIHRMNKEGYDSVSKMQHDLLRDPVFFKRVLPDFSINVTEMFRDPHFFDYFRKEVVPYLASFPKLKIWHAGCASGEEVYSMAILLQEEGLYDRATIYATDFNDASLKVAKEGIYPSGAIREYTRNYVQSGGKKAFSDYYTAGYESVKMANNLKAHISFQNHNLVTDGVFGEMDLILCRNVLIYFDRDLQNRVLNLFKDSLTATGTLCLGTKETIDYSSVANGFTTLEHRLKVYRKKRT